MFITVDQTKLMVSVDWLQFSVLTDTDCTDMFCPDGYRIDLVQGNNIFQHRAIVYDITGRKFLTLLWCPYSSRLKSNLMTVQVGNEYLYKGGIAGVLDIVQQIKPCRYNNMGRVDLCCDFEAGMEQIAIIQGLASNTHYCQGKSDWSVWNHKGERVNGRNVMPHCISWGRQSSDIRVKLYNKAREQNVDEFSRRRAAAGKTVLSPDKPYIVDMWREFGMDVSKVWRCEFALTGANQLRFEGNRLSLDLVGDDVWAANVFFNLARNRFVLRRDEGGKKGHHNDDTIVSLFPCPPAGCHLDWYKSDGEVTPPNPVITMIRKRMSELESPMAKADVRVFDMICDDIRRMVEMYDCGWYFYRLLGMSMDSYFERMEGDVGLGFSDGVLEPSRCFD